MKHIFDNKVLYKAVVNDELLPYLFKT